MYRYSFQPNRFSFVDMAADAEREYPSIIAWTACPEQKTKRNEREHNDQEKSLP